MSTEDNKAIFEKLIRLQESGDLNTVDQVIAPNWVNHDPSLPPLQGYEGFKQLTMLFRTAFPGFHTEIEDILAEGDKVAARMHIRMTNSGSFQGMPPDWQSRRRHGYRHLSGRRWEGDRQLGQPGYAWSAATTRHCSRAGAGQLGERSLAQGLPALHIGRK